MNQIKRIGHGLVKRPVRKEVDQTRVYELAREGLRIEKIAAGLGMSSVTLKRRLSEDELANAAYSRGRAEYAERQGKQAIRTGNGQLMVVRQVRQAKRPARDKDERRAIMQQPQYAIRHFIRTHPGATFDDIRRALGGLNEEIISDQLAVLSFDRRVIYGRRREGEEQSRFYPVEGETKPSLAA